MEVWAIWIRFRIVIVMLRILGETENYLHMFYSEFDWMYIDFENVKKWVKIINRWNALELNEINKSI